jgi:hypothetical protein
MNRLRMQIIRNLSSNNGIKENTKFINLQASIIMKTKNQKRTYKVKEESIQDLYKIYKANGVPNEMILSLGYVGLSEDNLATLNVDRRQHLFWVCQFLHVVVSEAMKEIEYRNNNKMLGFLQMALNQTDEFYRKSKDDLYMRHNLQPHNQIFERQFASDTNNI